MPQDMEAAKELIRELRKVVRDSMPKIVFYEEFIENRDWFKSTRIADELGISRDSCISFLPRKESASTKNGSGWSSPPAGHGNVMSPTHGRTAGERYIPSVRQNVGRRPAVNAS